MSARCDIYLMRGSAHSDCLAFCTKLVNKALSLGNSIYVATRDATESAQLSERLWQSPPESFLPHLALDQQEQAQDEVEKLLPQTPVLVDSNHRSQIIKARKLLISLGTLPKLDDIANTRFALIVPNIESHIQEARGHYRTFSQHGFEVNIHDLRQPATKQ